MFVKHLSLNCALIKTLTPEFTVTSADVQQCLQFFHGQIPKKYTYLSVSETAILPLYISALLH